MNNGFLVCGKDQQGHESFRKVFLNRSNAEAMQQTLLERFETVELFEIEIDDTYHKEKITDFQFILPFQPVSYDSIFFYTIVSFSKSKTVSIVRSVGQQSFLIADDSKVKESVKLYLKKETPYLIELVLEKNPLTQREFALLQSFCSWEKFLKESHKISQYLYISPLLNSI